MLLAAGSSEWAEQSISKDVTRGLPTVRERHPLGLGGMILIREINVDVYEQG